MKVVYSDHRACKITLKNLPKVKEVKEERKTIWNLNKEGGWAKYLEVTNECSKAIAKWLKTRKLM